MKRLLIVGAMPVFGLLLSACVNAAENNPRAVFSGVIKKVDYRFNSLVIVNDETGRKERYRFDDNTRVVFAGEEKSSAAMLEPGQKVILKLPTDTDTLATTN